MYKGKKIAVVVPVYNEELLISRVIDTMPAFVDKIVVVDDASRDNTVGIVSEYVARTPDRVILIRHDDNQGVGGAIATGYKWCRDEEIDIAAVMAGDAQMDPADLPAILDPIVNGEADYTKGNRLVTGEAWETIPRVRYLGNAMLSLLTKVASGYWHVADSQSGYTAISLKALKTINPDNIFKRYGMPNDLLVRLNIYNFRVRDVTVRPIYGVGEKSGIKPFRMIPGLSWLLIKLFFMRMLQKYVIRDFHPLIFFYILAGVLLGVCLPVLAIRLLYIWHTVGSIPAINALAMMMVSITGVQFLLFAMWFDMEYNRDLR